MNVLLGVTGSVAAIKAPRLVAALQAHADVHVVLTDAAKQFVNPSLLPCKVSTEAEEWAWKKVGDPVLHIELVKWADVLVVAPLSANTLAKFALGLCDNLLTCVFRAWPEGKPVVVTPAMNTQMWSNSHTAKHLECLPNVRVIDPVEKMLACGDFGVGAMAPVEKIVEEVRSICGV